MFDDRRRDHVAFGVGRGLLLRPTSNRRANRTSLRNSSVLVGSLSMGAWGIKNIQRTKLTGKNLLGREPNRPLSVSQTVGGIPVIADYGPRHVRRRNSCAVSAGGCDDQNPE
jgi:hypothetical protein